MEEAKSVLRILALFILLAVCVIALLIAPWWRRADVRPGDALSTIPASQVLTEASRDALCRPPRDADTARWDLRPFEKAELLAALKGTPEGMRVGAIRQLYLKVLGRDPFNGDCVAVRGWVDRPLALDAIERQIAASPEAQRVQQVRQTFLETVGRDPLGWDNASLRRWVESDSTPTEIKARLAEQRPLVAVHYFTWYRFAPKGWGNDVTTVHANAPQPELGWYTSTDTAVIDSHIDQMMVANFDFVIVNVVAQSPESWANAHKFFGRLTGRMLKAAVMLDGLYGESAVKDTWVEKVQAEFTRHPNYFSYHDLPLIMLFAARLNLAAPGAVLRNVYWTNSYAPGSNTFNLDYILYPRDWPFWAASPQPLVNGVVPVIPGYVDTHLDRAEPMEYPRRDGELYHEQWQRALSLRPELIIVYSWNEHFEQTAIESTRDWGDRYRRWTACYIAHAHSGTQGRCP